ncbi:2-keto-3-deoxy-D-arabino-heptulosonate-7- phosphate synthase I beta [Anaerovibrio sp. JC8]|uniref:3-deoxy-7-phosphoheptulonate synthase n=1 Tax=Anaerovibrio sp. JC8 TaxID=1240085 RepID=UPI000A0AB41B|nr:3-deoxy-7-phosphoheptulonate synthase [Anaerovibrio sp. JC8]ORU00742.1 2-keto-3-deoxy-D-arabino-heptulosonate-7- phosphate synthase I beta [Anaerovibrio sp. JC8]
MIIVMAPGSTEADLERVKTKIKNEGLEYHLSTGTSRTIVGVIGDKKAISELEMHCALPGVEKTVRITEKYKLVSREFKGEDSIIDVGGVKIGGGNPVVMAGPCAVESMDQLMEAAKAVADGGAQFLRGGAYKPRTSPYDFQGMAEDGLQMLRKAADKYNLKVVTEVLDQRTVEEVARYADVLQIGARNMQNFQLLKEVGRAGRPVLLKRGLCATIKEWLNAAEYVMSSGCDDVIFCERGIRTYETYTRNTLDLSAVVAVKELSHLPIIVDPSHGTGRRSMVSPMAKAAIAAGADGLIIEVHPHPEVALCDGDQSLTPEEFKKVMAEIKRMSAILREE